MRGVQRVRHSERERHPNGEGPSAVGQGGTSHLAQVQPEQLGDPQLTPPPGAPIRTAWIAGRIGLAFVDEANSAVVHAFGNGSRESLEALDVEERPYIWDL